MLDTSTEQLLKRYEQLHTEQLNWRVLWQEISEVIHPRRSQFVIQRTPGTKQTEKLFDSTALDANDRLASTLNGTLTSRAAAWFSLKMREEELNEDHDVQMWLEETGNRMFKAFNQSNFASEVHEVYLDEGAFGTAGVFEEERSPNSQKFAGLIFRALPLSDFVIDEDAEGRVNTVMRTFKMSAQAAVAKWGKDAGEKVNKAVADGKPYTMFEFLHVVEPRYENVSKNPTKTTPSRNLPWSSIYISMADKSKITEGGFHEFPFMIPRWTKTAGEKYGRGPGHLALPDVKTLNKVTELGLRTWAKTLDMPTKSIYDSVVGSVRNQPGGNTVVRDINGIQPLFPPGTFREAIQNDSLKADRLIASIRRIFLADQMELPQTPAMTAFEVAKRWELLERLLGPTMGRQEQELLSPLIERTFGIMYRHGAFSEPPAILLQQGADIDVKYEGPLAKSQRLTEVEGLERMSGTLQAVSALDPQVIDVIDFDAAIRLEAEVLNVPAKIMRSPEDVQKIRQQRAQAQADAQKVQNLQTLAESAGKAAPALKLLTMPQGSSGAA